MVFEEDAKTSLPCTAKLVIGVGVGGPADCDIEVDNPCQPETHQIEAEERLCSPTNNSLIFPASHIAQLFPKLVTIVTFGPSSAPFACLT